MKPLTNVLDFFVLNSTVTPIIWIKHWIRSGSSCRSRSDNSSGPSSRSDSSSSSTPDSGPSSRSDYNSESSSGSRSDSGSSSRSGCGCGHGSGLDRVQLCCSGVSGRNHWFCESRQRHLSGCRAPVWPVGRGRCLSGISKSKECLAVTGHLRNSDCGDGTEIHQLLEVHASRFNDFIKRTDAGEDHNWDAEQASRILNILQCIFSVYETCIPLCPL